MVRSIKDQVIGIRSGGLLVVRFFGQGVPNALPLDGIADPQRERLGHRYVITNDLFAHQLEGADTTVVEGHRAGAGDAAIA